jgi:hypothetical protein
MLIVLEGYIELGLRMAKRSGVVLAIITIRR